MNLNNLESFFTVIETKNFSKAGTKLGVSQSAISKQIKALEEQLGAQLFLRQKDEIVLTKEGRTLLTTARPFYIELTNSLQNFINNSKELKGKITFACYPEVGERIFIHALNKFKKTHPALVIEMRFLSAAEMERGILSGDLDLALIASSFIKESVRSYPLFDEHFVLVSTPKNSKTKIEELMSYPFVSFREHDKTLLRFFKEAYPKINLHQLNVNFMASSHKAMINAVKEQNSFAVLPLLSVQDEIKSRELIIIGDKRVTSKLHLVQLDLAHKLPRIEALKQFLLNYIKQ